MMKKSSPRLLKALQKAVTNCLFGSLTLILSSLYPSISLGDTLFYLTASGAGTGAVPTSPQESLKFLPGGGSFHIWVQPDTLFTGISLDITKTGSAITFTDATVYNPTVGSDTRWLPSLIRHGTVTASEVSRIEGGALAPLTGFGTGLGPTTSSSDPLYESAGGFLFATIDFSVPNPTETSTVSIAVGHNLISDTTGLAAGTLLFGVGDGPITNSSGSTGSAVDLNLIPRPLHPTDFDSDGDVDGDDLLTWQDGFGLTSGALRTDGDGNSDGKVDATDLALWQSQYSTVPASPLVANSTIPEPTARALAACAVAATLVNRRRRTKSVFTCA